MKKIALMGMTLLLIFVLWGCSSSSDNVIGKVTGAENEYICIGDVTYVKDDFNNFDSNDRDEYLGRVTNDEISMRIYSVKGDECEVYIYALWDWEGDFYIRQDTQRFNGV